MTKFASYITFIAIICIITTLSTAFGQDHFSPQPITMPNQTVQTNPQANNTCTNGNCPTRISPPPNRANVPFSPPPQQNLPPVQQENILIILDASYSMADRIGNERKIDIAKRVIYNTLKDIPKSTRVGFRVYGHKVGFMAIGTCKKSELLVPIQLNAQNDIISQLSKIQPKGATPIAYSIEQAVYNDFAGLNGQNRIILISDGMETCAGDPCRFAVELVRQGIDLKLDVVGFDLQEPGAFNQLKCIALSTGGKFFTTDTEASLSDSLRQIFRFKKDVQGKILP